MGAVPLPAGPLPDQAAPVQVFTGQDPEVQIRVDQPHTVRSVQFAKVGPDTRLRITYRDKAVTAGSAGDFSATMVVRIDGAHVPLLDTVFDAGAAGLAGSRSTSCRPRSPRWAGSRGSRRTHVLDTAYVVAGSNPPIVGFISGSPFLIEVVELP